jgi:hypothetical protein
MFSVQASVPECQAVLLKLTQILVQKLCTSPRHPYYISLVRDAPADTKTNTDIPDGMP